MLCELNDDVTINALFIACIAACEKVSHHELAVASMQRTLRVGNGTRLHSGSESQNLSPIGAMERAYSRPTFGMTPTS